MTQQHIPQKILITAALPYANGPIHFGHLAGAYLPADFYSRFQKLMGNEVCFICGSDEYGVAVALSSEIHGRTPQEHVDIFHEKNKNLFEKTLISFDHYSRTTAAIHSETTKEFFLVLHEKGLVTPMESEQLFCEEDNRFYADRYVIGTCPKCGFKEARGDECTRCGASYEAIDLINPVTKRGFKTLIRKKTTHWYLRLDLVKNELSEWIASKKSWKSNVIHFIRSYIEELRPRAITRDMSWGIPVPLAEAVGKVLYVWFDAPIGYISATKEWAIEKMKDLELWKHFWLDPKTKLVQFVGKDNIPFHAVIFPAMIMGQNTPFKLVDELPANEFYTLEGRQFSKSDGWYIDLEGFLDEFNPELLRYTIAVNAPENQDSEFTWKEFQLRVNTDLVGKLGNFIHRTLVFAKNNHNGIVPQQEGVLTETVDLNFKHAIYEKVSLIQDAFSHFKIRKASQLIMELAQIGNIYFDAKKPWVKIKEGKIESAATTIILCLDAIRLLGIVIEPILPETSQKIEKLLGIHESKKMNWDQKVASTLQAGSPLDANPKPLFQKIEDDIIQQHQEKLMQKSEEKGIEVLKNPIQQNSCESAITPSLPEITFDDFQKIQLEVVEIIEAKAVPKSKKLIQFQVMSRSGQRQIISGILQYYTPESLIGKKVVACTNLKPSKIMGLESQGMILAASCDANNLEVIEVEKIVPAGTSVH